uniref:Serpin domain-containing protein n=1 Tax=Brassica campestris TaxID=3711 RepID=M4DLD2_BRACM
MAASTSRKSGENTNHDLRKSVGKQNELALRVANHVIATTPAAKTSNLVFSPASINVVLSFLAAKSGGSTADHILSLLQASSTQELNTVSSKIVTDILADSTASGGPTISAANGVWIDKSLSVETSFKDLDFDVSKALQGLGLKTPLEKIVHKAYIEVDEAGTKAAAATSISCFGGCFQPRKKYDFVADHPFLFLVKEYRSGLVMFLGQVLDPCMH